MNEYLHGPIWVYDEEGFIRRKYPLIDSACVFDEDGYKAAYEEMIGIIKQIVQKLQSINNNDFVIEDYITKDITD